MKKREWEREMERERERVGKRGREKEGERFLKISKFNLKFYPYPTQEKCSLKFLKFKHLEKEREDIFESLPLTIYHLPFSIYPYPENF